jgi:KDO2-lipid IV(A) lauroyltransferase
MTRLLPLPVARAAFRFGADRAVRRGGGGVDRLARNLRQVVGPAMPDAEFAVLLRDAMRSYARYWLESFRLPSTTTRERLEGFYLGDGERLIEYTSAGQGVVLALAHSGNWDAAGAWVAASGMPITTVAERLRPEALYQRFVEFRESLGMEILPLTGGDRAVLDVLTDRLRKGHVVPLLADRDFSDRGVEVDFFGGRTRMPAGPAILAIRTGAPLHVVSMWYEADRPVGQVLPAIPVPDPKSGPLGLRVRILTQRIADEFAAFIAEHPADWHMLARMFIEPAAATTDPAEAVPVEAAGTAPPVGAAGPGAG